MNEKKIKAFFGILFFISFLSFPINNENIDFKKSFEEHGSIMLIINPETGEIENANKAAVNFYGYGSNLIGMNIGVINTLSHEEVEKEMQAASDESRNYFEFKHRLSDGTIRDVEVYSYPMEYEEEVLLYSVIQDISEKKKLERELKLRNIFLSVLIVIQFIFIILLIKSMRSLKKTQKELKRSERNLYNQKENIKTTLESIGDGVITTDSLGKITMINKVAENLIGCKNEECINRNFDEFIRIYQNNKNENLNNITKTIISNKSKIELFEDTILKSNLEKDIHISIVGAPIIDIKNEILGTIIVFRDVSQLIEKQNKIEYLSYHDALTGLYNRRYFKEEMKRLNNKRNYPISFIVGDINCLKLTNDVFGHNMGDELLKKIANSLKEVCRSDDILSRWGGDEFTLLLPSTDEFAAREIVNRIRENLKNKFVESIRTSLSLGFYTKKDNSVSMEEAFKYADAMMYKNKLIESNLIKNKIAEEIIDYLKREQGIECFSEQKTDYYLDMFKDTFLKTEEALQKCKKALKCKEIGNAGINSEILMQDKLLTDEEWNQIKKIPEIGYRILSSIKSYSDIAEIVLFHHERWDGKGYNSGLKQKEIPLLSRIIAVIEAYDAMINKRPFRDAMSVDMAHDELKRCSGKQFDPEIIKEFINKIKEE